MDRLADECHGYDLDGNPLERKPLSLKRKTSSTEWMVCPVCRGEGSTVNPNIDAHGLTSEDFREDPDFAENYFNGDYDIACRCCNGMRVIDANGDRLEELREHAEDRRLAAREDGDWESYSVANDYRYG